MKQIQRFINLLIIALLFAAVAAASGKIGGHTLTPQSLTPPLVTIDEADDIQLDAPSEKQLVAMGIAPKATLKAIKKDMWSVKTQGGKAGCIINTTLIGQDMQGYLGPTPLLIYINAKDTIKSIISLDNEETPSFYRRAAQLLDHYVGATTDVAPTMDVDAVSGATYTSKSLLFNIKAAISAYNQSAIEHHAAPQLGWLAALAVILVLALGVYVARYRKGKKQWRYLLLSLNILVLGFWTGQFLSISLLRGWSINGIDLIGMLPGVMMLLVALLTPFFLKGNHYCTYICPYGSLQELSRLLPIKPIRVPAHFYKHLSRLRHLLFGLLMLLLWWGMGSELLSYEPFGAFMYESAPIAVIILALAFLVAGLFIPRVWCRGFCPMGTALDLIEDTSKGKKRPIAKI